MEKEKIFSNMDFKSTALTFHTEKSLISCNNKVRKIYENNKGDDNFIYVYYDV